MEGIPVQTRTGTLWDHFLASFDVKTRPRDLPLAKAFFSDRNIANVEAAIQKRCADRLGPLSPAKEYLTVQHEEAIRDAVFAAAMEMGHLKPSADHLVMMNKNALDKAFESLSHESSTFARWDEFLREGVTPADAERPELDEDRLRSLELKRAPFGKGLWNPHESKWGGAIDTFDDLWSLIGIDKDGKSRMQEVTESDDSRIKVIPWAPVPRRERGSAPNHGPAGLNGWGYSAEATPELEANFRRATKALGGGTPNKISYF